MSELSKDKIQEQEELALAEQESEEVSKVNNVVGEEVSEVIETASDTIVVANDKEESAKKKDLAFSQHSTFFKQQLEQAMILEMQRQEMAFIRARIIFERKEEGSRKKFISTELSNSFHPDHLLRTLEENIKKSPDFQNLDEEKQSAYLERLYTDFEKNKKDYLNQVFSNTYKNLKESKFFSEEQRRKSIVLLERSGFNFPSEQEIDKIFKDFNYRKQEENAIKFQAFHTEIHNLPQADISLEEKAINYARFLEKLKAFNFSESERQSLVISLQNKGYLNNNGGFLGISKYRSTGKQDADFLFELGRNKQEYEMVRNASRGGTARYELNANLLGFGLIGLSVATLSIIGAPLWLAGSVGFATGALSTVLSLKLKGFYDGLIASRITVKSSNIITDNNFSKYFPNLDKALTLLEQQTDLTPEQKQVILDRLKSNDKKTVEEMQFNLIQAYGGQASEQDRKQALSNLI